MTNRDTRLVLLALLAAMMVPATAEAQWTNRYPKVDGYGHHVYLEGYELPTLTNGPIDAVVSPGGDRIAFSARGWIWLMDAETGEATRWTSGGDMDFRPTWSPSGDRIAFVRDNGSDTWIVVADVASGAEVATVNSDAIDLDPAFSADGTGLFYSSGEAGTLDIWHVDLDSDTRTRVTSGPGIELRPQPHPDGSSLLILAKGGGGGDRVEHVDLAAPTVGRQLVTGSIISMARPALSPDGSTVAINWPTQAGWELRLHDVAQPGPWIQLEGGHLPLTPSWDPAGEWIYFSEADDRERMQLKRVRPGGGPAESVRVRSWSWGEPTARIRIRTRLAGSEGLAPTRLSVVDAKGHPVIPDETAVHFDGQTGRVFFYSDGLIELTAPAGEVRVSAVQGLATPEEQVVVMADGGSLVEADLELTALWDARAAGYTSGEHHFHLNYGGQYDLSPEDLRAMMAGEDLDVATPLLANLHNRFEDQDLWGWRSSEGPPFIRFGQEIRSHFLGHLGLIDIEELYWPWVWGPGYQVYGTDDRTNGEVLGFARAQGGLGYYVHPISVPDPFAEGTFGSGPVELVADAVMGDVDALEVVCLWSDEQGTTEMWHRFLNLGIPVAPSAGTDVMTNLYRTMAVGTTRVYARTGEDVNWSAYVAALAEGRSFVTNGPWLDFQVGDARPGGVVEAGEVPWSLDLRTATNIDEVEILVNGEVVWSGGGLEIPGQQAFSGTVELPSGGWVAARAVGGETVWPSMDSYAFAHTGPVWIDHRGSTEPGARRAAAEELLAVLEVARNRLMAGYGDTPIPQLVARFDEAEQRLRTLVR